MLPSGHLHQSNIDLVEHLEYLIPSPVEIIRAARDGRANEEEERKVKGGDRQPIEEQINQI